LELDAIWCGNSLLGFENYEKRGFYGLLSSSVAE
jgi:hypothetical protein